MKRYVGHSGWQSNQGSGRTANKRQGVIRVGGGNSIDLDNGASLELNSANVAIDAYTGDVLVNINFYVRMRTPEHILAAFDNCTPEEFKEIYDNIASLSDDEAYDYVLNELNGNIF